MNEGKGIARPGLYTGIALIATLGLMSLTPARATIPAPPPPCTRSFDSEPIATLVDQVKDFDAHGWEASCASDALSRKGENVIPALISLMETHQGRAEDLALDAVCGPGHSGATALPYIERRLRAGGLSFALSAYQTLTCLGKVAKPAIPLLIDKSLGIDLSYALEIDDAIETLGHLSRYAPDRIIPHLIRLLDQPAQSTAAARALEEIGRPARSAESSLRRNLDAAVKAREDGIACAIISALAHLGDPKATVAILIPLLDRPGEADAAAQALQSIGPPAKPAIPALIKRLSAADTDSGKQRAVFALVTIDSHSPVVLKAVVDELARAEIFGVEIGSIDALEIKPFPPELAPALITAIERRAPDRPIRRLLEYALANTGTQLKPVERAQLPPLDVSDRLGDGLLALTAQSQVIMADDVVKQLHLDTEDYVREGSGPVAYTWRRQMARGEDSPDPDLVDTIQLSGVQQFGLPTSMGGFGGLPDTQDLDIVLNNRSCVAMEKISERVTRPVPAPSDLAVVIVSTDSPFRPQGTLMIKGDNSAAASQARSSVISVGVTCSRHITIKKSFDPGYWNFTCPLAYDKKFTSSVLLPALQAQLDPNLGQFDFDTPARIEDFGASVHLTYKEVVSDPARPDWQTFRLSLFLDRCSHRVSNVSKYIP